MAIKNFSPYKIVNEAKGSLKLNEQKVISGRFGIGEERKTLSSIGKELNLSRERVRQIEKDALKKLSHIIIEKEDNNIENILTAFAEVGGLAKHEQIAEKFLEKVQHKDINEFNSLNLIFTLIPQLKKIEKTKELEASWVFSTINKEDITKVIEDWAKHLSKTRAPESIDVLRNINAENGKYEITFLSELPLVSKRIIKTEDGKIGLASWPEINPRNVRDKIYFILKKEGKPTHFDDIAKKINAENLGKKKVVRATVHNELIADKRFVLVGRGIYALTEWGFKPGTVKDMIMETLKKYPKGITATEIVNEVLKQRTVKKNTILINLQTKSNFIKVGDKYTLKP